MRIGLHARNDETFTETDFAAIRTARIETLKIMDFTKITVLERVRGENPGIEFIVRLYDDRIGRGYSHPSPYDFVARSAPRINALRPLATKFEIHNEPNHYQGIEGWGSTDWDAQNFREWYRLVLQGLRQTCPWASFGFPGLALNYPHRDLEWLDICRDVILASDWLGCHTYWQYGNMLSPDWGLRFIHYRARFPDKPIEITEFGNSTPGLSPGEMATQYAAYYQHLQQYPYLGSASSFICSSPDPMWRPFAWCDPTSNQLFPVVYAVGAVPHVPSVPAPVYRVAYLSHTTPPSMQPGQQVSAVVRLRNDGNILWCAGGETPVRLGCRWYDQAGRELSDVPSPRTPLPQDVAAGQTATVTALLTAPAKPGIYAVRWDLIAEGVGWFSARGAATLDVGVRVQSAVVPPRPWVVSASHNTADAPKAIDDDPASAWSSGETQRPGMWFLVDLREEQTVSGVEMVSPGKDFPRGYLLEVSTDGSTWQQVSRKDPNWRSVAVTFTPVRARFVRITQTRTPRWAVVWAVSDITIKAAPAWTATASTNAADAAKAIDGDRSTVWSTGVPQRSGEWFQLDLGEAVFVERLRLDNTAQPQYPRGYLISASVNGQDWQEATRKASNWAPVDAALGPRWARYLRIVNTGSSRWHPWTIAEVTIITAPPPAKATPSQAAAAKRTIAPPP